MKKFFLFATVLLFLGLPVDAQMVVVTTNQQTPRVQRVDNSPVFRPTVGSLRFSAGLPGLFTVSYNHFFTSYFMIGGGTGLGYYYGKSWEEREEFNDYWSEIEVDVPAMPLFAEMDLRTPKYKWSLFLNVKVGVNLFGRSSEIHSNTGFRYGYSSRPFFASAAVGISYMNLNLGVGISTIMYNAGAPDFFVSYNLPLSTIEKLFFK